MVLELASFKGHGEIFETSSHGLLKKKLQRKFTANNKKKSLT
jgi:hypothetical protein